RLWFATSPGTRERGTQTYNDRAGRNPPVRAVGAVGRVPQVPARLFPPRTLRTSRCRVEGSTDDSFPTRGVCMRRVMMVAVTLASVIGAQTAWGQFGGFGGRGGRGGGPDMGGRANPAPKMPGAELEGPPDSAAARAVLTLSDEQAA